jgi:hypothetical protein
MQLHVSDRSPTSSAPRARPATSTTLFTILGKLSWILNEGVLDPIGSCLELSNIETVGKGNQQDFEEQYSPAKSSCVCN